MLQSPIRGNEMKPTTDFARWLHAFRQDGESERGFARRLGIESQTLRRIYEGRVAHQKTLMAIAKAINLPPEEVFRQAAGLTEIRLTDHSWLMSKLIEGLSMLTNAEQAEILAHVLRLAEKDTPGESEQTKI